MPEKYHTNKETSSTNYSKHSGKMKDIGCLITSALHFQAVKHKVVPVELGDLPSVCPEMLPSRLISCNHKAIACTHLLSQVEVVERNTSAETKSVPDVIILT
ncbi:hypothetical protein NC653_018493 [Populus alba x Populus x berolinensis]|uniref:Uncharacterized protein n=1 Tax=Populus alba x Populus x berolinensis TaxID=444605 RepID=A0AAD6QGN4_9ROSI|nr:hypothetical protein NC653_018493 [Populus alba x Populus x berolinensis]